MASFTCLACRVVFKDAENQRAHYKTDWHRYNLKRKVAELPPVTLDVFNQKVTLQEKRKEEKVTDTTLVCKTCNKTFSSVNSHDNHLKSKKHKEIAAKQSSDAVTGTKIVSSVKKSASKSQKSVTVLPSVEDDVIIDDDDDDSDEWEDLSEEEIDDENYDEDDESLPSNFCLFCPHESVNLEDNIRHMSKSHSFFIPDVTFVTDIDAFMVYLGAKVGSGKICLLCNTHSKQFQTVRACQKHMTDKRHCVLDYEGDAALEYADFYDFSSTYPDAEETDDSESLADSEVSAGELSVDPETLELILTSGARAGHRALRRYFNQGIPPEHLQHNRKMITGLETQYKALGWHGSSMAVDVRKRIVAKRIENRHRLNQRMAMGVKGNHMMKHFRKQYAYCG